MAATAINTVRSVKPVSTWGDAKQAATKTAITTTTKDGAGQNKPKFLTEYELIPLTNAVTRAEGLKDWAYTDLRLIELDEPQTIKYKKKPCWFCGKKTYTKPNPVYVLAEQRKNEYHFEELEELTQQLSKFRQRFLTTLGEMGPDLPTTAMLERNYITRSIAAIYASVEDAERLKQLNDETSLSNHLSDITEAISVIDTSVATIKEKKVEALRLAEQARQLAEQQAKQAEQLALQTQEQAAISAENGTEEETEQTSTINPLLVIGLFAVAAGGFIYYKKRK